MHEMQIIENNFPTGIQQDIFKLEDLTEIDRLNLNFQSGDFFQHSSTFTSGI